MTEESTDTRLARIDERLIHIIDLLTRQSGRSDDHETRLRDLEQHRWRAAGWLSAAAAVFGIIASVVSALVVQALTGG